MRHWDEIIALKERIGIDDSFRPTIYHPLRPNAMTERQRVVGFTFENMTPQAERFLSQKFHLNKVDSIDAKMEQELTTSIRMDLFYQTAECQLVPQGDGVRVVLSAGGRIAVRINIHPEVGNGFVLVVLVHTVHVDNLAYDFHGARNVLSLFRFAIQRDSDNDFGPHLAGHVNRIIILQAAIDQYHIVDPDR